MTASGRHVAIGAFVLMVGAVLVGICVFSRSDLSGTSIVADFEIVEYGRLEIERSRLPTHRQVVFRLGMEDSSRGEGNLPARVVSLDGRSRDVTGRAMPGDGTGIWLELPRDFLERGRYLIQVDTVERHSLRSRRYVLRVR